MSLLALVVLATAGGRLLPAPSLVPEARPAAAAYYEQLADGLASWGAVEAALANYQKSIENQPDRYSARLGVAEQLARLGRGPEALAAVDAILRESPRHQATVRFRGMLALQAGQPKDAERILLELLANAPEDAWAQVLLARAQLAQRDVTGAELSLRDAIRADPDRAEAHLLLAQVLLAEKHEVAATAALRRHLRLWPDNPEAVGLMAQLLLGQRRFAEALEWGKKLAAMMPDDPRPYGGLATCYEQLHQPDEAARAWRRVTELATDPAMIGAACEWLGRYHLGRGEFAAATPYLRRIVNLRPTLIPPRRQLIAAHAQAGQWLEAAAEVRGLIAMQPGDLTLRMQWIDALLNAEQQTAARRAIELTLRDFDRPELVPQVLQMLMQRRLAGMAIGLLETLRRRQPGRIEYTVMLADVWLATGDAEAARRLFEELLAKLPQDAGLRLRLSAIHFEQFSWEPIVELLEPLFPPGGPPLPGAPADLFKYLALAYEHTGRARKAARCYEQLAESAGEPLVLLRAARQYARIEAFEPAEGLCRRILGSLPGHTPSRLELAGILAAQDRLDEAAEQLEQLLQTEPRHPAALYDLVEVERRRGNLEAAARLCARLAEADRENDLAIAALGDIAWERDDRPGAIAIWLTGLETHPGSATLHARLAAAYEQVEDEPAAMEHYAAAARRASQDMASRLALVRLHGEAGADGQARRWARELAELAPTDGTFYQAWLATFAPEQAELGLSAGVELLQTGVTRRALVGPLLNRALDTGRAELLSARLEALAGSGDARPAALDARAQLLARQGRSDEAREVYRTLAAAEPKQTLWPRRLAELARAEGDLDGAVAAYRQALAAQPDDAVTLEALAGLLLERGDLAASGEVIRRLVALRPPPEPLLRLVEQGFAAHGGALRGLLESMLPGNWATPPPPAFTDNTALLCALGLVCEKLGDRAAAASAYDEAFACSPSLPQAVEGRRRMRQMVEPTPEPRLPGR